MTDALKPMAEFAEFEYRIVLELPNFGRMPLTPQGQDLDAARERLQDILDTAGMIYPKGWIERRRLNSWEAFCAVQTPTKKKDADEL